MPRKTQTSKKPQTHQKETSKKMVRPNMYDFEK